MNTVNETTQSNDKIQNPVKAPESKKSIDLTKYMVPMTDRQKFWSMAGVCTITGMAVGYAIAKFTSETTTGE